MTNRIEYNGFVIQSNTQPKRGSAGWTLEVHITPAGRRTGTRRCRAPNTYPSEDVAVARCLAFGRRIVDGELKPRADSAS